MTEPSAPTPPTSSAPYIQPAPPPPPQGAGAAPPVPAYAVSAPFKKPGIAGLLSMLPGVGHLYLGLYQRAMIFFSIFVVLIAITDHSNNSPIGIFIPFWMAFVLIDAVRQAHAINATGAPESNLVTSEKPFRVQGSLGFGIFLILFGAFFLLKRFVAINLAMVVEWWPLGLLLFGVWQVYSYYKEKEKASDKDKLGSTSEVPPI